MDSRSLPYSSAECQMEKTPGEKKENSRGKGMHEGEGLGSRKKRERKTR